MTKKLIILLFISFLFCSCGKKGDPVYNEESNNSKIISTQMSTNS